MDAPRPNPAGVSAVAIDLDGTLVDTAPDFDVAINRLLGELGLAPMPVEDIMKLVGKGSENLIGGVLKLRLPPGGTERLLPAAALERYLARCFARYFDIYRDENGRSSVVYPGVMEGLADLRALGLRLACVTNKPQEHAEDLLAAKGLRDHFELVVGGDAVARKKPAPDAFLRVCDAFALMPDALMAIGDSVNDVQAARAAGCPVLVVPYGYNHGQPVQKLDADGIVPTLRDAARWLQQGR